MFTHGPICKLPDPSVRLAASTRAAGARFFRFQFFSLGLFSSSPGLSPDPKAVPKLLSFFFISVPFWDFYWFLHWWIT